MSYAIRKDGRGWRAVDGPDDIGPDETYSDHAPTPVVNIPEAVTMRQARLALLKQGKLAAVNAAVAAMPGADGDAARIEWEFSGTVERNRPLVQSLATALGMTATDLDNLFISAAAL